MDELIQRLIDQVFDGNIRGRMYSRIEATMKKESIQTCILALSVYTEIVGGFVTGNLRKDKSSASNYAAFLRYLGPSYEQLNLELKYWGTSLYREIRSKIVHEFQPRSTFGYEFGDEVTEKVGLEHPWITKGIHTRLKEKHPNMRLPTILIIRPREYFRDFKNGVDRYHSDLEESAKAEVKDFRNETDFLKGDLFTKFMEAITVR